MTAKTLAEIQPGDTLEFGAYGPMTVATAERHLGGWNGQVDLVRVTFTTGLNFTSGADRPARIAENIVADGRGGWVAGDHGPAAR